MGTDSQRTSSATRLGIALAIVTITASAGVGTASAAGRTDPHANSPAGTIYQIPLDSGRSDAAPSRKGGSKGSGSRGGTGSGAGTTGAGAGSGTGSNGAASAGSAGAPGSTDGGTTGGASGSGTGTTSDAPGGGTNSDPSSVHSENGFGSSNNVPGVSNAGVPTLANASVSEGGGRSDLTTFLFLGAVGIVALVCGVGVAGRIRR